MQKTIKVRVSSTNRNSSSLSSTNFTMDLNNPLRDHLNWKIKLLQAEIPVSWYETLSTKNASIYFNEDVGANATAVLADGTYNSSTLITEIQTKMNAASPNGRTYTATYSSSTGKLTITISAGTFRFRWASGSGAGITTSAAGLLGYSLRNPADGVLAASQTSTQVINLAPTNYLYIKSNLSQNINQSSFSLLCGSQTEGTNWYYIPVSSGFMGTISYLNTTSTDFQYFTCPIMDHIDIQLFKDDNTLCDLNGQDFWLEFEIADC